MQDRQGFKHITDIDIESIKVNTISLSHTEEFIKTQKEQLLQNKLKTVGMDPNDLFLAHKLYTARTAERENLNYIQHNDTMKDLLFKYFVTL